jgi:hypothetical protein
VVRRFGTLRDGGPFENFFVVVASTEGRHVPRYEIFDVADADRALACFDELCTQRTTAGAVTPRAASPGG